jgi:hypothetical protein
MNKKLRKVCWLSKNKEHRFKRGRESSKDDRKKGEKKMP